MKKNICVIALLVIGLTFSLSAQVPEWVGMYRTSTTIDNQKAVTTITLNPDMTYVLQSLSSDNNFILTSTGSVEVTKKGKEIRLTGDSKGSINTYKWENNSLVSVTNNGKKMAKDEVVSYEKVDTKSIIEKYWKLIEVRGNAVEVNPVFPQEAYIIFTKEGNVVNGRGGCNSFRGTYTLTGETQIKLSQVISTMMACPDMELESQFLPVLEMADNYTISSDGKYLSLNKGRMAPLARFEVVYLK